MLPLILKKAGRVLVVGGGEVGARKVRRLLEAGFEVEVIALSATAEIKSFASSRSIRLSLNEYQSQDLSKYDLVFACTDNKEVNAQVASDARKAGVLVNLCDDPDRSDFYLPLNLSRGDLRISVFANGVPTLSQRVKDELETRYDEDYAEYVEKLKQVRKLIKEENIDALAVREIMRKLVVKNNKQYILETPIEKIAEDFCLRF